MSKPKTFDTSSMSWSNASYKWTNGRMSARPDFYSGRGVMRGDLGPQHLKMYYDGILADYGTDAAEQFCQFVAQLQDMSATAFLVSMISFYESGFARIYASNKKEKNLVHGRYEDQTVTAMVGMLAILGASSQPSDGYQQVEGQSIKNDFFDLVGRDSLKQSPTLWADNDCDIQGNRFYNPYKKNGEKR